MQTGQTEPELQPPIINKAETRQADASTINLLIGISAGALLAAFFLPWINVLFVRLSGHNLAAQGGMYALLWAIPVFAVITLFGCAAKQGLQGAAILTGALPFAFLAIGLSQNGSELFKIVEFGGFVTLVLGGLLIVLACKLR